MCFELDSAPPVPAISGAAISHKELELEAADGNRFAAFAAEPDDPTGACVVILPDVRGLYRFYEELALRLAERGHRAVAIDYFGRTAGVGKHDEHFEYGEHVRETTPEGIQADVRAAVEWLRGDRCDAIASLGFCFGGHHSWLAAAGGHGLAGAIGFYGVPVSGTGTRGRSSGPARCTRPCSRCRRAPTRTSPRRRMPSSNGHLRRPESSTKWSSTRAHHTASSIASKRTSRRRQTTPGSACSRFSNGFLDPRIDVLLAKRREKDWKYWTSDPRSERIEAMTRLLLRLRDRVRFNGNGHTDSSRSVGLPTRCESRMRHVVTAAESAPCTCPDFCERDHEND